MRSKPAYVRASSRSVFEASEGTYGSPRIHEALREIVNIGRDFSGVDITREPIIIQPGQHYFMGGVICGADTSTELPGLFVAGETAGGIHGANRLGANSLVSCIYGGFIAAVVTPVAVGAYWLCESRHDPRGWRSLVITQSAPACLTVDATESSSVATTTASATFI